MVEAGIKAGLLSSFSIRKAIIIVLVLFGATAGAKAATITVPAGGNLQSAVNAAQYGDTIVLQAGAVYTVSLVLPLKSGTGEIVIQSSRASELPNGVRVTPDQSALLAKLQSITPAEAVVKTVAGAHHYRFVGIEFSTGDAGVVVYDLIRFGEGRSTQTTLSSVPHDLVIDRCYIHGFATQNVQRGISLNSAETTVSNSYISDIHGVGYDTQAVGGWNGPGPFHIINNYLEGAGENIMFGGSDPASQELVPANIEIRRNYVFKPLSWKVSDPGYAGYHWTVKNLFELKNARNVIVDGNVFENNWTDAQSGVPVLFTVRNQDCTAPYSTVQNVTFTNNTVKNAQGALNFLGKDNEAEPAYGKCPLATAGSTRGSGVVVNNNLFYNINGPWLILNGFYNVSFSRNTHVQNGNLMTLYSEPSLGFSYNDNLTIDHDYGIFGDGGAIGTPALTNFTPGYGFSGNVIATPYATYPVGNSYPSSLTLPSDFRSPFSGKGADIDVLNAVQSGVNPNPSSTPTPTPTPTVTPTPTATPTPNPSPTPNSTPSPTPTPTPTSTALSVAISSPANNSTFSYGSNVTITATATDTVGTVTSVKFYAGSQLIGTSNSASSSVVWSNIAAGTYSVTATAADTQGLFSTSPPITVKISKTLKRVRTNRQSTSNLTANNSLSASTEPSESVVTLDSLVTELEQTYNDFNGERSMFNSEDQIEKYLIASLLLARSSDALAKQSSTNSGVIDRLTKIAAYLSFCDDLMVSDSISQESLSAASKANAQVDLLIAQPITSPIALTGTLWPGLSAKIDTTSGIPFTTQTGFVTVGKTSYELLNVNVTIGGKAASLLMVSPTEITFVVPTDLPAGLADVVVTSRSGSIFNGTAAVAGLNPRILGLVGDTSGQAAAQDAVAFQSGALSTTGSDLYGLDSRTRVSIWASGISTGVTNSDGSNDIFLDSGQVIENLSESVQVEARTSDGTLYLLPVEFAGTPGTLAGLDQVNAVLLPELRGAGPVQLTIVVGTARSNTMTITVR